MWRRVLIRHRLTNQPRSLHPLRNQPSEQPRKKKRLPFFLPPATITVINLSLSRLGYLCSFPNLDLLLKPKEDSQENLIRRMVRIGTRAKPSELVAEALRGSPQASASALPAPEGLNEGLITDDLPQSSASFPDSPPRLDDSVNAMIDHAPIEGAVSQSEIAQMTAQDLALMDQSELK